MKSNEKLIIDGIEVTDIKDIEVESKEEYIHSFINFDGTVKSDLIEAYITKKDAKIFNQCLEKYRKYNTVYFGIKRIIPQAYCIYGKILDLCEIKLGDETIRAYMTRENFHKFGEKIKEGEINE